MCMFYILLRDSDKLLGPSSHKATFVTMQIKLTNSNKHRMLENHK